MSARKRAEKCSVQYTNFNDAIHLIYWTLPAMLLAQASKIWDCQSVKSWYKKYWHFLLFSGGLFIWNLFCSLFCVYFALGWIEVFYKFCEALRVYNSFQRFGPKLTSHCWYLTDTCVCCDLIISFAKARNIVKPRRYNIWNTAFSNTIILCLKPTQDWPSPSSLHPNIFRVCKPWSLLCKRSTWHGLLLPRHWRYDCGLGTNPFHCTVAFLCRARSFINLFKLFWKSKSCNYNYNTAALLGVFLVVTWKPAGFP